MKILDIQRFLKRSKGAVDGYRKTQGVDRRRYVQARSLAQTNGVEEKLQFTKHVLLRLLLRLIDVRELPPP